MASGQAGSGGLTIAGGFHISTKALLVLLGTTVIGGYLGTKLIGSRPVQLAFNANNTVSKAYVSDTNLQRVKGRLISIIARLTKQPGDVFADMDQVVGKISLHEPQLAALVQKRKTGE